MKRQKAAFIFFRFSALLALILPSALFLASLLTGCGSQTKKQDEKPLQTEPPFTDANEKYQFANDSAAWILQYDDSGDSSILQYPFDGSPKQSYQPKGILPDAELKLLFVDNDAIFLSAELEEEMEERIITVPIKKTENGQKLLLEQYREISLPADDIIIDANSFYATKDYLFFGNYYNMSIFIYDRKTQKQIKPANAPDQEYWLRETRPQYSRVYNDYVVYNTTPTGKSFYRAPYGFSCWRLGGDSVKTIDQRCYTTSAYTINRAKGLLYYQIETDQGVWSYDFQNEKKQELISEKEIYRCYAKNSLTWTEDEDCDELFVQGEKLYLIRQTENRYKTLIFSYALNGGAGLTYEKALTETLHSCAKESGEAIDYDDTDYVMLSMLEGKLLYCPDTDYYFADDCYCIDLETAQAKSVTEDQKQLYFALVGAVIDTEETTDDTAPAETPEEQENRRFAARKDADKAAKRSVREQISLLAAKTMQFAAKQAEDENELASEPYYATITDLDHNGVLELLLSTGSQGSGLFTSTTAFYIGADGKAVKFYEDTSADLVENPPQTAYYNKQKDTYYYVSRDNSSGGMGARGRVDGTFSLKDGAITEQTISGWYDDIDHKSAKKALTTFYREGDTEKEKTHLDDNWDEDYGETAIKKYEKNASQYIDNYYRNCEKQTVTIKWNELVLYGDVQQKENQAQRPLTQEELEEQYLQAYNTFARPDPGSFTRN